MIIEAWIACYKGRNMMIDDVRLIDRPAFGATFSHAPEERLEGRFKLSAIEPT